LKSKVPVVAGLLGLIFYAMIWTWFQSQQKPVNPTEGSLPYNATGYGPAHDISIITPDNKNVSLSSLKGKVVLVDFWGTWCNPCMQSIPGIEAVYNLYHAKGMEVMGVALENDNGSKVKSVAAKLGVTYTVGLATKREDLDAYKPDSLPMMYIVDKKGIIRYKQIGFDPAVGETEINVVVKKLLEES